MPNWCTTGITFYSKDRELVEKFYDKVVEILNGKPTAENDFGKGWLGDYANTFFPELGHAKINCRGMVECIDDYTFDREDYICFSIATCTAWGPKIGIWREIIDRFYKGIEIAYLSEECGCAYYNKWDETGLFYPEVMYVDCCYPDENGDEQYIDEHNFDTIPDLAKWLNENIPQFRHTMTDSLSDLADETQAGLEKLDDGDERFFFNAEWYQEFPISEFDFLKEEN